MILLVSSILLFVGSASAQYDTFTFNMTMMCRHDRHFTYDITFNVRQEDPGKPIQEGEIGHINRQGNGGLNNVIHSGFYEFELSRAPAWEPVVLLKHNCQADQKGRYKTMKMIFTSSPALRNKTRYIYKFYMDITDKAGTMNVDAEIKAVSPK